MSYDLYLIHLPPGSTPDQVETLALAKAEAELPDTDPDPESSARQQAIADALRIADPKLEPFTFDYAEIARLEHISEQDARRRYRYIELTASDRSGIQITVYDDWVSLTVPYWHRGENAGQVWEQVWLHLRVLCREGAYTVYDPQLGRELDLAIDSIAVGDMYAEGVNVTTRAASEFMEQQPTRKPWWKFWD